MRHEFAPLLAVLAALAASACGSIVAGDAGTDGEDAAETPADDGTGEDVEDGTAADDAGCSPGEVDCDGSCVDTSDDPRHCGRCGNVCPAALHAEAICEDSTCGLRCEPGYVDLDDEPGCETACFPTGDEVCNDIDDDCDGETDEDFECRSGEEIACTTACGSTGTALCDGACTSGPCTPPRETCNRLDDDCDAIADNGLYETLWSHPSIRPPAGTHIHSFSVAASDDKVFLGYVAPASASGPLGRPTVFRVDLASGNTIVNIDALASASVSNRIRAAQTPTRYTAVWDTGDDSVGTGEAAQFVSAQVGLGLVLGRMVDVDGSRLAITGGVSVARYVSRDSAVAAWVEDGVVGRADVQVALLDGYEAPTVAARHSLTTTFGAPRPWPDVAVAGDSAILVVWDELAPPSGRSIVGQRYEGDLVAAGGRIAVTGSSGGYSYPRVTASGMRFAVTWSERTSGEAFVRLFDAAGAPLGAALRLGSVVPGSPVAVAPDLLGGFAAVLSTVSGVELVRFSADGVFEDTRLVLPGGAPEIGLIPGGGFVVAHVVDTAVQLTRIGCTPTDG